MSGVNNNSPYNIHLGATQAANLSQPPTGRTGGPAPFPEPYQQAQPLGETEGRALAKSAAIVSIAAVGALATIGAACTWPALAVIGGFIAFCGVLGMDEDQDAAGALIAGGIAIAGGPITTALATFYTSYRIYTAEAGTSLADAAYNAVADPLK